MLAEGKLSDVKLSGYVEADFLSAGVTSNNNQSNSYTLRQRQVWGQARQFYQVCHGLANKKWPSAFWDRRADLLRDQC